MSVNHKRLKNNREENNRKRQLQITTQPADDCMMDEWVRPEAFMEAVTWRWAAWRQAGRKEKEPLGHVHPHVPTSSSWAKALAV